MGDSRTERELAQSLDANPALLPWLGELLQDVWALGCDPETVVGLLERSGLGHGSEVLDLACGKGAIAIPLARATGCRVTGIDLFEDFVRQARELAISHGVSSQCNFVQGDMRDLLTAHGRVDAVIYASVGALGRADCCVETLRRSVRPGGLIVIDDGYLIDPSAAGRPGYEHYLSREDTRRFLCCHGDEILREVLVDGRDALIENRRITALIRARALELCSREPQHADLFMEYVARQETETEFLDERFQGAVWLLRRA